MQSSDKRNTEDSPYASPRSDSAGGGSTFSLATLMVVVVLCAVGFGIAYYTIGLGVAFFIIAGLAFARVKLHHHTAWVNGFAATALGVTLVVVLTPICCGVAFFTNCLAGVFAADQLYASRWGTGDGVFAIAVGLGVITALQVAEMIFAFGLRKKTHETS